MNRISGMVSDLCKDKNQRGEMYKKGWCDAQTVFIKYL